MTDGTFIYDNISRFLANFGEPALWACPIQQGIPILFNLVFIGLLWFGINAMAGLLRSNSLGLLMSFGDEEKIKASREGLRNGVIGLIMVLMSLFFFVMFVRGFIGVQFDVFDSQGKFNGFFVVRNIEGESLDQCQAKLDPFGTTTTTDTESADKRNSNSTLKQDTTKKAEKQNDTELPGAKTDRQASTDDSLLLPNDVQSNDLPIPLGPTEVQS